MAVDESIKVIIDGDASGLDVATRRAGKALGDFKGKSVDATNALGNLSRVAQDAPFGFIGIANNLNPLLESFQRLQKESGGTAGALKSMVAGLAGPAGIGVALSAASSLLTAFAMGMFDSKEKTEAQDQALDELNKTLDETAGRIEQIKGALSFSNEIGALINDIAGLPKSVDIGAQVIATRDAIIKLDDELKTLNETRSALDKESTPTGDDKESKAIRRSMEQRREAIDKKWGEIVKDRQRFIQQESILNLQGRIQREKEADEELKDLQDANEKARKEREKAYKEYKDLLDKYKKTVAEYKLSQPDILTVPTPDTDTTRYRNSEARRRETGDEGITGSSLEAGEKKSQDFLKKQAQIKADMENLAGIISDTVTPAFQGMFDSILAGEEPLKAFFASLGASIQQLISKLIAAALQAAVLSFILPGGGGGFGSLFGKALGFTGMATGGIVPPGYPNDSFPAMLSSGETVIPLSRLAELQSGGGGQVIIMNQRLRGRDSILQQHRENKSQRRGG